MEIYNIFRKKREKMGLSIEKLSKETGISRYIIKKIEGNQFSEVKLEEFIKLCKYLNVNIYKFLRNHYLIEDEIYGDNLLCIVHNYAKCVLQDIIYHLKLFAQLTHFRYDSFDLFQFIDCPDMLYRLKILNQKLQKKEISIQDALEEIPPIKWYERRKI